MSASVHHHGVPPPVAPEGNAHQAEFTADSRFIIGTDEDFDPYRLLLQTGDEENPDESFWAKPGEQTTVKESW